MNNLLFYILSLFSILSSLMVIVSKNPVHSVLGLILVFFNVAGFFVCLGAEFLAFLFIVVYVGAVAVLFLFIIMMLNIKLVNLSLSMYRYFPLFFIFGFIFFSELFFIFLIDLLPLAKRYFSFIDSNKYFVCSWYRFSNELDNVFVFSNLIYTYYVYLFVVSGVILLVSMIGAISLTLHRRNDVKRQYIYKQMQSNFDNSIVWKI